MTVGILCLLGETLDSIENGKSWGFYKEKNNILLVGVFIRILLLIFLCVTVIITKIIKDYTSQ